MHCSGEESKYGVEPDDALPLCRHVHQECHNLRFAGLMTIGMADYTSRPENFQVGCHQLLVSAVSTSLSSCSVISCCVDTGAAQDHLRQDVAHLIVIGAAGREDGAPDEFEFVRWIRRSKTDEVRLASVILLTGHTLQNNVARARDCGASFVIAKPITPLVLYERIVWLAKDERSFINAARYVGPDRRFQKMGPPSGLEGRRRDDLSLQVGEATVPNLSQAEIDAMLGGKGMARP